MKKVFAVLLVALFAGSALAAPTPPANQPDALMAIWTGGQAEAASALNSGPLRWPFVCAGLVCRSASFLYSGPCPSPLRPPLRRLPWPLKCSA